MNLLIHTARAIARRLPPSIDADSDDVARVYRTALAARLVVALPFGYNGLTAGHGGGRGNPVSRAIPFMTQPRLSDLVPVLNTTPDALTTHRERGYQAQSADETLAAVAAASGKQPSDALVAVLPAR